MSLSLLKPSPGRSSPSGPPRRSPQLLPPSRPAPPMTAAACGHWRWSHTAWARPTASQPSRSRGLALQPLVMAPASPPPSPADVPGHCRASAPGPAPARRSRLADHRRHRDQPLTFARPVPACPPPACPRPRCPGRPPWPPRFIRPRTARQLLRRPRDHRLGRPHPGRGCRPHVASRCRPPCAELAVPPALLPRHPRLPRAARPLLNRHISVTNPSKAAGTSCHALNFTLECRPPRCQRGVRPARA